MRIDDVTTDIATGIISESGVFIRKGTILTTILNIRKINELLQKEDITPAHKIKFDEYVSHINDLIPSLKEAFVFELFNPLEWLNASKENLGRIVTVLLFFEAFPTEVNQLYLLHLKENVGNYPRLLKDYVNNFLNKFSYK